MRESSRSYRFPALLPGDVSWDSTDQSCVWIHRNNSPVFFWDPASYVAALQHHVSAIVTSLLYQISNRYALLCWPHNLIAFFFFFKCFTTYLHLFQFHSVKRRCCKHVRESKPLKSFIWVPPASYYWQVASLWQKYIGCVFISSLAKQTNK